MRKNKSFIEAFMAHNANLGVPEKFLLWSAISGIAGCLERKTWMEYNGIQTIYPNLFVMLISKSGGRKSTAANAIMKLMYEVEGLNFLPNQTSGAAMLAQMQRVGSKKNFEFGGEVYKSSSVFSFSSEAANTIGQTKGMNGVQELLTDLYDNGDPNIWSNKKGWVKETLSGGQIEIFNPCLNILYCSTPTWLMKSIGNDAIAGGFASRILFINQKEMHGEDQGMMDDEEIAVKKSPEGRQALVDDLKQIASIKGKYKREKGYVSAYNLILRDTAKKIREGGDMEAYYKRKMWYCMKLSQVLAANESNELVCTIRHLEMAREHLEALESDMYWAFSTQGENKNLMSLIFVWDMIRKKQRWAKQTLVSATFKHANSNQLDDHIKTLANMGKIKAIFNAAGTFYEVLDNGPLGG